MSQVIKVDRELYRVLKERARDKGIPIKEALSDLLGEERKKQEELQSLLEQKKKELESLLKTGKAEKERLEHEISVLENEIIRLRKELHQQKQKVEALSSALEGERETREAIEEEAVTWKVASYLLLPLGMVAGAVLFDIYQSLKDNPEALILLVFGGIIGGVIGHNKGENGALIGTALGIAAGGLVVYLWDWWKRRRPAGWFPVVPFT